MRTVREQNGKLVVDFEHAKGLKTKDGKAPTGFWLADDTESWVPADASIWQNTVTLTKLPADKETPLYPLRVDR